MKRQAPKRLYTQVILAGVVVLTFLSAPLLWFIRRWNLRVHQMEIPVAATQPSPHRLRKEAFIGERP
ncbi:MAG: hypothetical protein SF029_19085, partial [bacterium]|nr:hypothetical protein [bacterium]